MAAPRTRRWCRILLAIFMEPPRAVAERDAAEPVAARSFGLRLMVVKQFSMHSRGVRMAMTLSPD
jgi:hypothetical protein